MDGVNELSREPMTLLSFNSRDDLKNYALGVDRDIGGTSTAQLDFVSDSTVFVACGRAAEWRRRRGLGRRPDRLELPRHDEWVSFHDDPVLRPLSRVSGLVRGARSKNLRLSLKLTVKK